MKKVYNLLLIMTALIVCASCNNEWESEQYVQLVSFKAGVNAQGVTPIYVRYKPDGKVTYPLPLIVSGSTMSTKNLTVHIGLDPDTLARLNVEHFGSRKELFFKELGDKYYEYPETVEVPAGECAALLPINFSLGDLDQVDKWVLPLAIQANDPSFDYQANPRKHYRRAMLRIFPFNDYSGGYSATAYKVYFKGNENEAIVPENKTAYVVDEKTVFFYAGLLDIDRLDRRYYKIFCHFTDDLIDLQTKKLEIYTDNPDINLVVKGQPSYSIEEEMDATRPYLKHMYLSVNLEYDYRDYTSVPGYPLDYTVKGTLIMERKINTQIPDEDQAIEW